MFFPFKEGRIHYTIKGEGKGLVLLHGYLESSEVWNGFETDLALTFRVISVDLPGHGLSSVYSEIHTMEFMAEAIKDLLDHLRIRKAFMIGHSLGGYVSLAFLELYPDYLSGYSLFHSQPLADSPEAIEKRKREISIVRAGKKELMYPDNVMRMYATTNLEKFSGSLIHSKEIASRLSGEGIIAVLNGMMSRPSRLKIMEEGRSPCLWILGSMDNYIDYRSITEKVKLPDNAQIVVLNNSGHMGFIEEESLSVEIIRDFVNGVSTTF
jgi:pimeloyl-ACP methyl ester carboxylesterase